MAYSAEIAKVLTNQLVRFATLNRHQLFGQVSNLDFWMAEVRHSHDVIDGYNPRFERLKTAQTKYAAEHDTIEFGLRDDNYNYEKPAAPPKRVPDGEMKEARQSLCDATYHFLVRCFKEGAVEEGTLRQECSNLDIGIDAMDLKRG